MNFEQLKKHQELMRKREEEELQQNSSLRVQHARKVLDMSADGGKSCSLI